MFAAGRPYLAGGRDAQAAGGDKIAPLAGQGLDLVASGGRHRGARRRRAALPGALLVHARPGVAADHQPLPRGHAEFPPEWLRHEYYDDDVNKLADVARSERGISTLHEATGGDPGGSPRWHANMPSAATRS